VIDTALARQIVQRVSVTSCRTHTTSTTGPSTPSLTTWRPARHRSPVPICERLVEAADAAFGRLQPAERGRPSLLRASIERFQQDAPGFGPYPLPNVWIGSTIESDAYVWRANVLRRTPAAVRFVSAEPLLSGLPSLDLTGIDWLIAGGESGGPADRAMTETGEPQPKPWALDAVRDLRDRCVANGTAFFHKQWGGRTPKAGGRLLDGRTWDQFPEPRPAGVAGGG
jgi:hypothetical protein